MVAAGATLASRADAMSIRQGIAIVPAQHLACLDAAIREMQRRSEREPNDPTGWRAHAPEPHFVCAAVSNADDAQVYECWRFLPWHRAFLRHRLPFLWLDGTIVTLSVAETLDARRLVYVYDPLGVFRDGVPPADAAAKPGAPRQPMASETLRMPPCAAGRTLRIACVQPTERPVSVEIVVAREGKPATALLVAIDRIVSGSRGPSRRLCDEPYVTAASYPS